MYTCSYPADDQWYNQHEFLVYASFSLGYLFVGVFVSVIVLPINGISLYSQYMIVQQTFSSLKFIIVLNCSLIGLRSANNGQSVFFRNSGLGYPCTCTYKYNTYYLLLAVTCNLEIQNINVTKILWIFSALHTFLLYVCYRNTFLNCCQACENP